MSVSSLFNFWQQNDSNLCIITILSLLSREIRAVKNSIRINYCPKYIISNISDPKEKEKFEIFDKKNKEKRLSPIIDNFYGYQVDIYKCENKNCGYVNYTFQILSVLNLPIVDKNNERINSLKQSMKYYQEKSFHYNEKEFSCKNCNQYYISTQSILISLPKIFIINLKRLGEQNFYSHNLEIPRSFEAKEIAVNWNHSNFEYELTGFIKHYGGANSGHNIAICKNFFDSIWYEYNDSRVKFMGNAGYHNNNIDLSNGFLFFYVQKDNVDNSANYSIIAEKARKLKNRI